MPTMTLTYKQFPSGAVLRTIAHLILPKKTKEGPLRAETSFQQGGHTYVFLFWDAIASLYTDPDLTFTTPDDNSSFAVDAWYVEQGSGPPVPVVTTYAFSLNQHGVFPNTPIASVTPSGAWTGPPSTTVKTDTSTPPSPVRIAALDKITGYGLFNSWLQFCTTGSTVSKKVLTVPANGGGQAIAFYGIPTPDPCQGARDNYNNYNPDPGTPPNVVHAERLSLWGTLNTCEVKYGETLTPKPA